jgi:hypothetical protein
MFLLFCLAGFLFFSACGSATKQRDDGPAGGIQSEAGRIGEDAPTLKDLSGYLYSLPKNR